MTQTIEIVLSLDDADNPELQKHQAAKALNLDLPRVRDLRVRRRSLDARGKNIRVQLRVEVWIDENAPTENTPNLEYSNVRDKRTIIIVGCGPAGMFAALRCIELGFRPVVVERGGDVQSRRRDLARINRDGIVNPESNYCFGEGGAGTYSDGKLYTRVKDKVAIHRVLEVLVSHGADADILVEAHPHIGSNKLPQIVQAMRQSILSAGGEIHFNTRVVDFVIENQRMRGVVLQNGEELHGESVILASGHSGREIFELLMKHRVLVTPKPFAMGVRIEHPQPLIDKIQYRNAPVFERTSSQRETEWRHPKLPAASYRLAHTSNGRGVFSFCMCPGGWIVPSATRGDEVVVNGMSLSRRDSPFANSGLVVSVETEDLTPYEQHGALAGVVFQRDLETRAFAAGGNEIGSSGLLEKNAGQVAPAQRVTDFLANRISSTLPKTSYQPGINSAPMHEVLPPFFSARLQEGLSQFGKQMRGYITDEAILVGVETRTSSPLRVPRDDATLQHPEIAGLFPCGEGAGYAGGIVSAAIDGARSAEACAANIEYSML